MDWESEMALIRQFQWGLREDVKDLLLTLPDAITLSEAITQVVRCDNRLFLRKQERKTNNMFNLQPIASVGPTPSGTSSNDVPLDDPMQVDVTRFKPLTQEEKDRRWKEGLCLYCGEPGHKASNCLKKSTKQRIRGAKFNMLGDSKNAQVQSQ